MNKNDLHLLVQSKCHRVPLRATHEEITNPTGILAYEYSKIMKDMKDAGLFKSREEAERNCTEDYAPVMVEFEI